MERLRLGHLEEVFAGGDRDMTSEQDTAVYADPDNQVPLGSPERASGGAARVHRGASIVGGLPDVRERA